MKGSHSPKTRRMQMRISYAETDGEGKWLFTVLDEPRPNYKIKMIQTDCFTCVG